MLQKRLTPGTRKSCFPSGIMLLSMFLCLARDGQSQIHSAELQAAGLTCAMCSNAINKSLKTLSFIQRVDVDLKRSSFTLLFNPSGLVDLDAIRNKVEDAGFSVSSLSVQATATSPVKGNSIQIGSQWVCFVVPGDYPVTGNLHFKIIDKGFVLEKEYKKYRKLIESVSCAEGAVKPVRGKLL